MDMGKCNKIIASEKYNEIEKIEEKIYALIKLMNIIKSYENPYKYVTISGYNDNRKIPITVEVSPELFFSDNKIVQIQMLVDRSELQQAICNKYHSMIFTKYSGYSNIISDLSLKHKINWLYAERLKYTYDYCVNELPPKYSIIFKENDYKNIYELVKNDILEEMDKLVLEKIQLLT